MPSNRKHRAKERRSRQADLTSDLENVDVMLGVYSRNELESNSGDRNDEVDLASDRTRGDVAQNSEDFRSLLNSNSRENSESTIETMRLVNSEVSRQIDELRRELNSQLVDAINSAITEKVLPDIRNIVTSQNPVFREEVDHKSSRLSRTTEGKKHQIAWRNIQKPTSINSNNHPRSQGGSFSSLDRRDDRDMMINSHDMVTGANPTPRTVPEFLTGLPMHSRIDTRNQNSPHGQSSKNIPSVPETSVNHDNSDPIRRLADVLVGMNSKSSLTFDGKSEKFELFEDIFHTMMKHATQHDKNNEDKPFSVSIAQKFFEKSTLQELNGLEEIYDLPVPTMTSAPSTSRPGTGLLSSGIDPNATCNCCKKPGHVKDDCRKLKRKEQANSKSNDGQSTKKKCPKCPTCDKTNHQAERCWKRAGAHLKPKNSKLENSKTDDASTSPGDTNTKTTNSIPKNLKK